MGGEEDYMLVLNFSNVTYCLLPASPCTVKGNKAHFFPMLGDKKAIAIGRTS